MYITRQEFDELVSNNLKLIRTEYNFTQEHMSEILGLSKKTLVQVEKNRQTLGWSNSITVATIFRDSTILINVLSDDVTDLIQTLAFGQYERKKTPTLGGKVWWKELESTESYTIQQNYLSKHYRILDANDHRISSALEYDAIKARFDELNEELK